ncbi:lysozyme [Campylobacter hyointestinalis]|uniref:Lysozyme n=1 Tax=Campylobacter hyointestinalis TaxID=198 RepID=A0A562XLT7_CAMHY|nr:lysozyme [Campylobacter hyointestinalis]TWO22633.1 lysozyme [Campylobacter hyointestinalis]
MLSKVGLKELIDELKVEEGFRANVYQCSEGVDTIGYGFNVAYLTNGELALNGGFVEPMSKEVATEILEIKVRKLIENVDKTHSWINDLPEMVRIGLYGMIYQLGIKGFDSFVNTQKYLKALNYSKAIENIKNSKWAKQTPRRANNLIKRLEKVQE